jgi:putative protease
MAENKIELLAPAKDLESGIAAINCGADAVYIGAPKFGARAAVGNSIGDISKLIDYAHKYWVKVYATVNTIIYDDELEEVRKLVYDLCNSCVDAIIFQDMALLEMDLPPVPLFASTQTHNYEIERIKFLDELGIKRIILARELSLEQIKSIKAAVKTDLEFFVHGALCVCLSGQCYLSEAMLGRSANRGECAQPCRLEYTLVDANGNVIVKDKHLLSIRDLNLSAYLYELIDAGITSFKIEGRLKDITYVKNITAYYRKQLDSIMLNNPTLKKSSSGFSIIPFTPDPDKTFNRGYTSYFIDGKDESIGSIDSPKSKGKYLGKVISVGKNNFLIDTKEVLVNGDGICFHDDSYDLKGMSINKVEGNVIYSSELEGIKIGTEIFRNHDHAFVNELKKDCFRKILVNVIVVETEEGLEITAVDEDNISVTHSINLIKESAKNPAQALNIFKNQFSKCGDTIFEIDNIEVKIPQMIFLQVKTINETRRIILNMLEGERIRHHKREKDDLIKHSADLNKAKLDYRANVVNKLSNKFYKMQGAEEIENGFELQKDYPGKVLMMCKYCIKDELDMCQLKTGIKTNEPFFLVNNRKKYQLIFDCKNCFMKIVHP